MSSNVFYAKLQKVTRTKFGIISVNV